MPYGFNPFSNTSTSYQNKRKQVQSFGSYQTPQYSTPTRGAYSGSAKYERTKQLGQHFQKDMDDIRSEISNRSALDRIFDVLQIGQFAVQGAIAHSIDKDKSTNALTGAWEGIKSGNPFGEDYTKGEYGFADNLDTIFGKPETTLGKVGRFITGFVGDVALDPLTYVSLGGTALLKGTGKVGKGGTQLAKTLSKADAVSILRKAGSEVSDEAAEALIKKVHKYSGIKQGGDGIGIKLGSFSKEFVDADTIRMLGDETIAPYINTMTDYIANSKAFGKLDSKQALKRLAKKNPKQLAQFFSAVDIMKGHSDEMLSGVANIKTLSKKMFSQFDEDELVELSELMENVSSWGKSTIDVDVNDMDTAKELIEHLNRMSDNIDIKLTKARDLSGISEEVDTLKRIKNTLAGEFNQELVEYNNLKSYKDELQKMSGRISTMMNEKPFGVNRVDNSAREVISYLGGKASLIDEGKFELGDTPNIKSNRRAYADDYTLPFGILANGDYTKFTINGIQFPVSDLGIKSADDFMKAGKKRAYRTSKEAATKAIQNGNEEVMYGMVKRIVKSNPALKGDFAKLPLATNLSADKLKKFLTDYYEKPLGEFARELNQYKEGYDMIGAMLDDIGLGYKYVEEYYKILEHNKLADAGDLLDIPDELAKKVKDRGRMMRNLLADPRLRMAEYADFINKGGKKMSKELFEKEGKRLTKMQAKLDELSQKLINGNISSDEARLLDSLEEELLSARSKHASMLDTDALQRRQASYITSQEIDDILKREYTTGTKIGDDAYYDPWLDTLGDYGKKNGITSSKELKLFSELVDGVNIAESIVIKGKPTEFEYRLAMLKKFVPEKSYSQLIPEEKEFIDGMVEVAKKKGKLTLEENISDYSKGLLSNNIKLGKVDKQLAILSDRLARQKELYHKAHTDYGKKAIELNEQLNKSGVTKSLTELKSDIAKVTSNVENARLEEYLRGTMGDNRFDELFNVYDDFTLADPRMEAKYGEIARKIRSDMDKVAKTEDISNTIDNYIAHIVKKDYINLGDEEWNEIAALLGISSDDFNPHSISRKIKGTISEYKADWDAGKYPKLPRDLFEDNMAKIYTTRMIANNKFMFEKNNYEPLLDLLGDRVKLGSPQTSGKIRAVPMKELRELFDTYGGMVGKTDPDFERLVAKFNIPDSPSQVTTPLYALTSGEQQIIKTLSETVGMKNISALDVHPTIMREMQAASKYQYSEGVRSFLDTYDKFLHLWKMNVTVVNPNFHIRNEIGNTFNNYLDMGVKAFDPKYKKMVYDIGKGLDGEIVAKNGKKYSYEEIRAFAEQLGITDTGFFGWEIRHQQKATGIKNTLLSKINPMNTTEFIPYKAGTKVGSVMESHGRLMNFVHHLQDGKTAQHAKDMTDQFLFDYSTATEFEKEVMRRVIPFWTWMKNNIPLQAEQLINNPKAYMPFAKIRSSLNNAVQEDERVDRAYVNDFARDWWQLPGTITNEHGNEEALMLNPNLPYADLNTDLKDLIGKLSPFIKVPFELATNRHTFYEQPIYEDYKNPALTTVDHIASQLTAYNVGKSVIRKQGSDRMLEIMAYLTGIRVMSYDAEKYKYMKIQEELEKRRGAN